MKGRILTSPLTGKYPEILSLDKTSIDSNKLFIFFPFMVYL